MLKLKTEEREALCQQGAPKGAGRSSMKDWPVNLKKDSARNAGSNRRIRQAYPLTLLSSDGRRRIHHGHRHRCGCLREDVLR